VEGDSIGEYDLITTFGEVAFETLNRYHEKIPKEVAIVFLGSPTGWHGCWESMRI
jgi:hypothetical protein